MTRPTAASGTVTAVLGPTNTGKTHYAIERMLSHQSGVIGLPLRLLAREVYDRVVEARGADQVALVTGEEKIAPKSARYFVCTVESMPLDGAADFVAIDEIQLAADGERGHVFTDRLLKARGRRETLFLGAATMRERIAELAPGARFESRERFSKLTYAGSKKLSRLPARTAVVAFSTENVYAIAELMRRQRGGAAVVMGALSPRTRNAQVALFQEGDVDFLIATDAIGMGLNLDVRHVAFAGLRKFDGRRRRHLEPQELAQIAGRAGRHMNDGTFGVTGEAPPLGQEVVDAIEEHHFAPVRLLQWRNSDLAFSSVPALLASLERGPPSRSLRRAREAEDEIALRHLARISDIADRAKGRTAVALLWDVCQVPDFRKTMPSEHAALIGEIFRYLTSPKGVVPEDWFAQHCERLDRNDGDIDALSKRLAYIRTWTYVANRRGWLGDPVHWRERTRAIEDKLSDALHERLTQRFVDRRTSVLARRLKQRERLVATVDDTGRVTVEGEFVGSLEGFRFVPDPSAAGAEGKTLQAASAQALGAELARRVEKFYASPDAEIDVTHQGGLMWGDAAVGRIALRKGASGGDDDPLSVAATAFADDMLEPAMIEKIERRLQFWLDRKLQTAFEPLFALRGDESLSGLARGLAYQLIERYGVIPRSEVADDVKALDQEARGMLRKHGVRFGQHTVFIPALLKPAPTRMRVLLWGHKAGLDEIPAPPPPGHVTIPVDDTAPTGFFTMAGYRSAGPRALRFDMLERLADMIRPLDARNGFEATPEMLSITGATLDQFAEVMTGLGFRAERGERPKAPKPPRATKEAGDAPSAPETADADLDAAFAAAAAALAAAEGGGGASVAAAPAGSAASALSAAPPDEPATASAAASGAETTPTRDASTQVAAAEDAVSQATVSDEATAQDTTAQDTTVEKTPVEETSVEETPTVDAGAPAAADPQPDPPQESPAPTDAAGAGDRTDDAPETAAAETAQEAPSETPAEAGAPDAAAAETEVFYRFTLAPRGRGRGREAHAGGPGGGRRREGGERDRGPRRRPAAQNAGGAPGAGGGDGDRVRQGRGGKPKDRQGEGGDRQNGGPPSGDGKARGKSGKPPRRHQEGGGQRSGGRNDRIDPDSPFAVLQKLKDQS